MPRLFAAIKLPQSLSLQLSQLQGGLNGTRWIDPENYHITLAFFGDINHHIANDITLAFSAIDRPAMELRVDRLDVFGNDRPRALYAHIENNSLLFELQSEIERIAKRHGAPCDRRKFIPHITLARLKDTHPREIAGFIHSRGGCVSPFFDVDSFDLLSSKASIGGGPYITEARFRLHSFDQTEFEDDVWVN